MFSTAVMRLPKTDDGEVILFTCTNFPPDGSTAEKCNLRIL
jgi:hypothetical protein